MCWKQQGKMKFRINALERSKFSSKNTEDSRKAKITLKKNEKGQVCFEKPLKHCKSKKKLVNFQLFEIWGCVGVYKQFLGPLVRLSKVFPII